jgi:hypothetical protein
MQKENTFRTNISTFNASISSEGISLGFFPQQGKIFAHDRWPLSELHHRYLQYVFERK